MKWCSKASGTNFFFDEVNIKTCLFTKTSLGWLWHTRLAHVGMGTQEVDEERID